MLLEHWSDRLGVDCDEEQVTLVRPSVLLQAPVESLGLDGIHEDGRRRLTLAEAIVELKLKFVEDLLGAFREGLLTLFLGRPLLFV